MEADDASADRSLDAGAFRGSTRELATALNELAQRLRSNDRDRGSDEPGPTARPASEHLDPGPARSEQHAPPGDRGLVGELMTVAADLAFRLAAAEEATGAARKEIERLEAALSRIATHVDRADDPPVSDEFYWAFEERMRGTSADVTERLVVYAGIATDLVASVASDGSRRPRWVDLGCGRGEFCALLRDWGWDVEGVDRSASAIEACRELGIDASVGDVFEYLDEGPAAVPEAISAIQLIEHLPRDRWPQLFEAAFAALRPGGALLLETINGQNVRALADHFVADLTHTWPGHPQTLRLLAEHTGFVDVAVRFEHPDRRGNAEDVAIWARKPKG